jgi:hypothetical protein
MTGRFRLSPLAALLLGAAAPAAAQDMMPNTVEAVLAIGQEFGPLTREPDNAEGRPVLSGEADGLFYSIVMYGCDGPEGCLSAQFYATFEDDPPPTIAMINDWNGETRFIQAYLDPSGVARVSMAVNLRFGVTRANFRDSTDLWVQLIADFADFLYGPPASTAPMPPQK